MKYEPWTFVTAKGAPEWLQSRLQKRGPVYRICYKKLGFDLRVVIKGRFESWKAAAIAGESLFEDAKKQSKTKPGIEGKLPHEVLCSDVVVEILKDKDRNGRRDATYNQAELFYRKHILPFLGGFVEQDGVLGAEKVYVSGECPRAMDLSPQVWKKYVDYFRSSRPDSPLFNHHKFFVTLFRYCKDHKLIDQFYKLEFSEKKDDDREDGRVLTDSDFEKMVFRSATRNWRNRIIIQRWTGGRPGEVRELRKAPVLRKGSGGKKDSMWPPNIQVEGDLISIRYYEFDTKNKKERAFFVESELVKRAILEQMSRYPESPYLFPNERNHSKPMDKCLNGWYSTLARAGVADCYTPHDLRHTYLTDMFKTSNEWAVICYQAGLSLDEAQKTYLHMDVNDTRGIARIIASKAKFQEVG